MGRSAIAKWLFVGIIVLSLGNIVACNIPDPPKSNMTIPTEYADVHMPEAWWNNEAIINEGRQLYLGMMKPSVNCAHCHGEKGEPVRTGALNFREAMDYSDSHLLWRISEGVPMSTMGAYKSKLSQDEIWKVIAFVSSLGMEGMKYDPETKSWVSSG